MAERDPINVKIEKRDAGVVVSPEGEIGYHEAPALQNAIKSAFEKRPARLVIDPRRLVFRDMGVDEIERAVLLGGIGLVDAGLALAQHLHLGPGQHHAGLDRILDQVVVPRLAVLRRIFVGLASRHGMPFS